MFDEELLSNDPGARMILVFVVFVWIVVLSVVVGLCVAAGIGDRAQLASAGHSREQRPPMYARPSVRAAESRESVLDRDGVAA
jgi:hypothetical protein